MSWVWLRTPIKLACDYSIESIDPDLGGGARNPCVPLGSKGVRSIVTRQRAHPNIAPLYDQGLARRDTPAGMNRPGDVVLIDAVDLKADEALLVGLVYLLVDEVLDHLAVDPGLDSRPPRYDL